MLEEHRNAFLERSPVSPSRTAGEVPKIPQNDTDHDRGEVAKEQRPPQREWPSSRLAMQMEATRVGASIAGGALERIFQTLRDEIDHHLPPDTAVVWEEKNSLKQQESKDTYQEMHTRCACA